MNFADNYRIMARGTGDRRRFAVQRRIPARKRWFFWTIPETWEFVQSYRGVRGRIGLWGKEYATWEDAVSFMQFCIAEDRFEADTWKVWE